MAFGKQFRRSGVHGAILNFNLDAPVFVRRSFNPAGAGGRVHNLTRFTIGLMTVQPEMTKSRPLPVRIPPFETPMQTPPRKIKKAMMIWRLKNRAFINLIRLQVLPVVPLGLARTEPLWPSY